MKILVLISLLLFSCTKNNKNIKSKITMPLSSNISTLDPAVAFDEISLNVIYQLYETLYEYKYNVDEPQIIPLLAEDLPEIDEKGTKYTFKIKKNIQYHDHPAFQGQKRTLKAQDFINQIKRLAFLGTKSQGFWLFDGKIEGINEFRNLAKDNLEDFFKFNISGVQIVNDYEFSIKLTKPYPQMIYAMTMAFTVPVPEEVIRFEKNNLNDIEIGTGPFILKEFSRSHRIIIQKFSSYHDPELPKVETFEFPIIKEAQTRWLNFLKNKIDFFAVTTDHFNVALNPDASLKEGLQDKGFLLKKAPTFTYWWLSFNMNDPVVGKNLNLRKAIAHAIDVDKYIELFTNNTGIKANSIYHPYIYGYSPSAKLPYQYNIEVAKKYLSEAGFPEGKGLSTLQFDTRSNDNQSLHRAEFIKSQLHQIGIDIKITTNNFPTFLRKAKEGKLQFWQDGWTLDYPDSENILQLLLSTNHPPGPNTTYYNNPSFDSSFSHLAVMLNTPAKKELMENMEQTVLDDAAWIMQFYSQKFVLYNKRIQNYFPSPVVNNFLKYLEISN
ncbi:MAG: hypothetical protein H6621_05870 [Halobacteriovoraceae bacterium]|nr:hypothetical protein [Halobacteriovoraceae bacterium]